MYVSCAIPNANTEFAPLEKCDRMYSVDDTISIKQNTVRVHKGKIQRYCQYEYIHE